MTAWTVYIAPSSWDGVDDQRLEEILAGIAKLRPSSWIVKLEREGPKDPPSRAPKLDKDGDLLCPELGCTRVFVSQQALGVHRTRAHGVRGATK